MNLFSEYLARFIRRVRLAIGRAHVPHCEDCRFFSEGICSHKLSSFRKTDWSYVYDAHWADAMRRKDMPCGKHGKLFEPKESE